MKIISGGQTGVDRAALDVALELRLPHGGWCPKGRLSEDGTIPTRYSLTETPLANYQQRTEWNVRDSDATLLLTFGKPLGGTKLTLNFCKSLNKPSLVVDLNQPFDSKAIRQWLSELKVATLNIAGPRESFRPGAVHGGAYRMLKSLLLGE